MEIYKRGIGFNRVLVSAIIIAILWIIVLPIGIYGEVVINRQSKALGNGYLILAKQSPSTDMALEYLYDYREAVEENGFTKGTAGVYFKTPENDMSFRYKKLNEGIKFLEDLSGKYQEEQRLNTIDIATINRMVVDSEEQGLGDYIDNLGVGIRQYLSANYIGWRFLDVMSWIALIYGVLGFMAMLVLWATQDMYWWGKF
jgi:hypothetical protein